MFVAKTNINTNYASTAQRSYKEPKPIDIDIDVLNPYKSSLQLTWIGCKNTDYSRDWSITTQKAPKVERINTENEWKKNGQRTTFIFGYNKPEYASTNSLAKSYKPYKLDNNNKEIDTTNKNKEKISYNNGPKYDLTTLQKSSWNIGSYKRTWETAMRNDYMEHSLNNVCEDKTVSTSELQKNAWKLGFHKTKYDTTIKSSFIKQKEIPQFTSKIKKADLQKTHIYLK